MPIAEKPFLTKIQIADSIMRTGDEAALFPFFASERSREWLDSLNTMNQVVSFTLKIVLCIAFIVNAFIELAKLITAKNRNFDRWFAMFMATAGAITGGTAIISLLLWGSTFVLFGISGPWIFMMAMASGIIQQMGTLISNIFRAIQAPKGSQTRAHYRQGIMSNLFSLISLGLTVFMLVVVMISPAGPAVAFAVTMAAATAALITTAWYLMSWLKPQWTGRLKAFLGFDKPQDQDLVNHVVHKQARQVEIEQLIARDIPTTFIEKSLFKRDYHKEEVYQLFRADESGDKPLNYLRRAIENKVHQLVLRTPEMAANRSGGALIEMQSIRGLTKEVLLNNGQRVPVNVALFNKNQQKMIVLTMLYDLLDLNLKPNAAPTKINKAVDAIADKYPKAYQSFFADVGDTQDLFNAAKFYLITKASLPVQQEVDEEENTCRC